MKIPNVTIQQLLEAGVHLGHKTLRWNPKMKKYIFGKRDSIHIIDLTQTLELTKIALEGTPLSAIEEYLNGPSMIAYSDDPITAPKITVEFAKANEKFIVLGGSLPEKKIDLGEVKHLASLPSLDELRAKMLGLLNAPASNIASLINTPGTNIAQVVKAYSDKAEAA